MNVTTTQEFEAQTQGEPSDESSDLSARADLLEQHEPRNIIALAAYHICLRTAWVFKTETVLMPRIVDVISGEGWVRGMLPILNRIGQSVPPMLVSEHLKNATLKKHVMLMTTCGMAVPFYILAIVWFWTTELRTTGMTVLFLVCYALFFACTGMNQLSFNTVQGKLIRPARRGRLLSVAGILGSIVASTTAWFLLGWWLSWGTDGFPYIFAFTATGFMAAALCLAMVFEPKDPHLPTRFHGLDRVKAAVEVVRTDARFRRATGAAMLFVCALLLTPHYQKLGRAREGFQETELMIWVIVQNIGAGFFSWIAGRIADRRGNRLALRLMIFTTATIPPLALSLSALPENIERNCFWITYFVLGVVPVTFRVQMNYLLELAVEADHPRYVSTMSLCMALPIFLSPLAGFLVDLSLPTVFLTISVVVALGGLMTFRMDEPRHDEIRVATESTEDTESH